MKTHEPTPRRTFSLRPRRTPSHHSRISPTVGAAALALGIISAPMASAEVVAGWDTWDSVTAPTVSVTATGVTASATASAVGGTQNWSLEGGDNAGRGSSGDGTWGSFAAGVAASSETELFSSNITLTNGKTDGEITFTIINNGATDLDLNEFNFDAYAFRPNAARTYALNVLAGSDITIGNVFTSTEDEITSVGSAGDHSVHDEIDIDLTGLADSTLEVGGTAIIQLAFSDGSGSGGGHHLFLDNVALTTASSLTDKLVITSAPASANAGADFSVTVEAQNAGGSPIAVTQDTTVSLSSSGEGILAGATGTILTGTSSVVLGTVSSDVAETITLTAASTAGDPFLPSIPSAPIDILAGPATDLFVETAADGSGEVVGPVSLLLDESIDVFAITRDALGNFIANDPAATFTLTNITGDIFPEDLEDNLDGSANFVAIDVGTCNISASLSGFTDAESGLITTEELTAKWDRTGGNSSWGVDANWVGDVLPAFTAQTDLFLYDPIADDEGKVNTYMAASRTIRSLNYTADADANFNFRTTVSGTTGAADLIFDTDSLVDPAELNVDADATGTFKIGNVVNDPERVHGDVVLEDDLKIVHLGSGILIIDANIRDGAASHGITLDSTSTGTVNFTGTNSFTGATNVNGGVLIVNGESILDTATLAIDGGVVDIASDEIVGELSLGGVVQPDGIYGSSASAAPVPDDVNFSGTGTITVGTPPVAETIVIDSITKTGTNATITFTSSSNVDVYRSTDLINWGAAYATDQPSGSYTDTSANGSKHFYVLVPTGDPGP